MDTTIIKWTVTGIVFGLIFPLAAMLFDNYIYLSAPVSIPDLMTANPIHFIVALAPLVLGITFFQIGIFHSRLLLYIKRLEISEQEHWVLANKDALTGVGNRHKLVRDIEQDAAQLRSSKDARFIALADLDRFKSINDSWGHEVGDATLRCFSDLLSQNLPVDARIYRLGGDEFVILFPILASESEVRRCLDAIITLLKKPVDLGPCKMCIGASFGVALHSPICETPADDVLHRADLALYEAKKRSETDYCFYHDELSNSVNIIKKTEVEIAQALEENEFFLEYQPMHATNCHSVVGVEALVRWRHPQLGIVAPGTFIDISEKTGQIIEIGEFVLREACRTAASWKNPIDVSVNVSVLQFRQDDFSKKVRDILGETKLCPKRLILEITETLLLDDIGKISKAINALRRDGVRIALDDFGTGFTSVNNLRQISFDRLKLDRSLTESLVKNTRDVSIVKAIIELCEALEIETTIEGVETKRQLLAARKLRIDNIQGFYFSKPLPSVELCSYMRGRAKTGDRAKSSYPQRQQVA